jgi:hypothetical protein
LRDDAVDAATQHLAHPDADRFNFELAPGGDDTHGLTGEGRIDGKQTVAMTPVKGRLQECHRDLRACGFRLSCGEFPELATREGGVRADICHVIEWRSVSVGKEHRKTASIEEIKRAKQAGARASRGARDSADVCAIKDSLNAQQAVSDVGRRLGRKCAVDGGSKPWIRAELREKTVVLPDAVIVDEQSGEAAGPRAQCEEARANPGLVFVREGNLKLLPYFI